MNGNDGPGISPDQLSEEQRELLAGVEAQRRAANAMNALREKIRAEADRQNRWVERQIWETDWTEVEVLDIVTLRPTDPVAGVAPDLTAYRYANEEDAPDDVGDYAREAGRRGDIQRITDDMFRELVEENGVEPPEWLNVDPEVGGDRGPDDEEEDPDEFEVEETLQELREERLNDMEDS